MVVDVTTLTMARKPLKLQKENLAGCAGEGKGVVGPKKLGGTHVTLKNEYEN